MKRSLALMLLFSLLHGYCCSLFFGATETGRESKVEATSALHYRLPSLSAVRADRSILGANDRCLDQSEISKGTIIRTKDSRALGAKFLNETSLGPASRDQCLILCCSNPDCNVAVYEERDGGNCYLFDCGSPEDFRCKFTSHTFYTSAVLRKNNHEDELAQLKLIPTQKTTTEYYTTKPTTTTIQPVTERKCSRYQFECHTSGECIAIYNACDGIPQCADGSDEAPELGCPATTTTTSTTMRPMTPHPIRNKLLQYNADSSVPGVAWKTNRDRWSNQDDLWISNNNNHVAGSVNNNNEDRHPIFGQNGNIVPAVEQEKILPRPQYVNNAAPSPNEYVNRYPQSQAVDSYGPHYYEPPKPSRVDSYNPAPAYQPSIYAYNWNSPTQFGASSNLQSPHIQEQQIPPLMVQLPQGRPQQHPFEAQYEPNQAMKQQSGPTQPPATSAYVREVSTTTIIPSTTVAEVVTLSTTLPAAKQYHEVQQVQPNHASVHELHINQAEFKEAKLQRVRQTTGAIWALSLGLCITLILVALVGCRLRSLKWNLKRGRGSLARDEDYLVNGLYL